MKARILQWLQWRRWFCSIAWAQCAWSAMNSACELCKATVTATSNGHVTQRVVAAPQPAFERFSTAFRFQVQNSANCFAIAREKHGYADRVPLERRLNGRVCNAVNYAGRA
jgi:CRISPR/Cas system-associated protein Cas7 (RAMP superfamily)